MIVGFPGETEEEFLETERFLRDIRFAKTHIFKYSRRRGTAADKMPGQLTEAVKHERSKVLDEFDRSNHRAYMESFIGEREEILVESEEEIDGRKYFTGLTKRYVQVAVPAEELPGASAVNSLVKVDIAGFCGEGYLLGSLGKDKT